MAKRQPVDTPEFRRQMVEHGEPTRIAEVVCDMSAAFLAAAAETSRRPP